MGGDEFVIRLRNIPAGASQAAESIAARSSKPQQRPFDIRGHDLTVTPSIGIALFPRDGGDAETLIKHADAAMYLAKEQGRNNYQFFGAPDHPCAERLLAGKRPCAPRSTTRNSNLHYQPQLDTASGELIGFEACCAGATRAG